MLFSNALKPITYALGIFAMFFITISLFLIKLDYNTQSYCNDAVEEFVDKSRATGIISFTNYQNMVNQMTATGNVFDIKLIHESKVAYPGDNLGESIDGYYVYNTEDILTTLADSDTGTYILKNGDYLKVSFTLREPTLGSRVYSLVTTRSFKTVYGSYGGYVGSTGDMGLVPADLTD